MQLERTADGSQVTALYASFHARFGLRLLVAAWLVPLLLLGQSRGVCAQELLSNPSFEIVTGLSPAPVNGNNFYANPPGWTITPANTANIVKPWSGYSGNALATPTGGGIYYFDLNSGGVVGTVNQSVTLATPGVFNFSAWFSVRDNPQALTGCTINILNSANAVVATASVSFAATDPIGLWKQAAIANVGLPVGTYTFQVVLPDPSNVDLASFYRLPPLTITKTSTIISDPVEGATSPKSIPGSIVQDCILATNTAGYAASNVVVSDTLPANLTYVANTMASGTSCAGATTKPAPGASITGNAITATVGALANGASYALVFNAQVN